MLLAFMFFLYVLLHHILFQRSKSGPGLVKIIIFFIQMLQVIARNTFPWLTVLTSVLTFSVTSVIAGPDSSCIAPISEYNAFLLHMFTPLIMLFTLAIVVSVSGCFGYCFKLFCPGSAGDDGSGSGFSGPGSSHFGSSGLVLHGSDSAQKGSVFRRLWTWQAFARSFWGVFLFAYQIWLYRIAFFNDCIRVGSYRVMASSPSVSCESDEYRQWSIFYWIMVPVVLAMPCCLIALFWKHRKTLSASRHVHVLPDAAAAAASDPLSQSQSQARKVSVPVTPATVASVYAFPRSSLLGSLGVLYEDYKPSLFWFELVVIFERVLIMGTSAIADQIWPFYPARRLFLLTMEFSAFLLLHATVQPLLLRIDNALQSLSLLCLTVNSALAMYHSLVQEEDEDGGVRVLIFISVTGPLLIFLAFCIQSLYRILRQIMHAWTKKKHSKRHSPNPDSPSDQSKNADKMADALEPSGHAQSEPERNDEDAEDANDPFLQLAEDPVSPISPVHEGAAVLPVSPPRSPRAHSVVYSKQHAQPPRSASLSVPLLSRQDDL
jgi:hypothetical protein